MKTNRSITGIAGMLFLILLGYQTFAQDVPIQYFRRYDQRGINVFETPNTDTLKYEGFKFKIGKK